MKAAILHAAFLGGLLAVSSPAECPQGAASENFLASIEGRFVNREFSPVHVDLVWRHAPLSADTFDIILSGRESFRYVSTENFRFMEYRRERARRQMATHHLVEFIGESPLTWEHFERLARGFLPCDDSLARDSIRIHGWKSFDGVELPAILDFRGKGGSGALWVRSVQKIVPKDSSDAPMLSIFGDGTDSEAKIPLILQMH